MVVPNLKMQERAFTFEIKDSAGKKIRDNLRVKMKVTLRHRDDSSKSQIIFDLPYVTVPYECELVDKSKSLLYHKVSHIN